VGPAVLGHAVDDAGEERALGIGRIAGDQDQVIRLLHDHGEVTLGVARGRHQPERRLLAVGDAIPARIPVVVLVDRASASASEIVTGALQDRRRATVVGTRTYGKGVFQEVDRLPNGGALKITVGEYFTPNGRNLGGGGVRRGAGVEPDVRARDKAATPADEALAVALRTLARKVKAG